MKRLLLILAAFCDPDRGPHWRAGTSTTPHDGGTLRISTKDTLRTLDPAIAYDDVSPYVMHPLFDTLVDYEPARAGDPASGLRLVPRLAERWEVSPDGLTYHFWLHDGITYADGRPIVAADFRTSFDRVRAMPDSPFVQYLEPLKSIEIPNDRELVLHLVRPDATFLYVLAMTFAAPLRADFVAAAGDQLRRQPLASGPYMLELWSEGERIVLRKNPHYFDPGRAHLERLELFEGIPRDTQFLMFERGELDAAERLSSPDTLWLLEQPAWRPFLHDRGNMNAYGIRMNVRRKPFDDRRVRQALNYALDKQHTVKLLNGGAEPSHGLLPPGMFGRDAALAPYPHDPAKARALLAAAGYPHGFDVDYVTVNDEEAEKIAASIQSDLAEVGVRVQITELSFTAYVTAIGRPDGPPFSLGSWVGDFPDPANFLDTNFHSRMIADENSNDNTFYANPELDALLDAAHAETDATKRDAMYRRAERILYDDAPWVWNYHRAMLEVTQPYVRGYEPHPVWGRDYTSAWLDDKVAR
jgi:oligopeptide transport system substrate-binding protein